jgi:hypothetical protein
VKTTDLPNLDCCAHCGHGISKASSVDEHPPRPGDVTVCFGCAHVYEFDERMRVVELSDEKRRAIEADARLRREIVKMRAAVVVVNAAARTAEGGGHV